MSPISRGVGAVVVVTTKQFICKNVANMPDALSSFCPLQELAVVIVGQLYVSYTANETGGSNL